MNPRAYNAGSYGLFQVQYASHSARVGGSVELLYDPVVNVRVAHEIWASSGWGPWSCRP